jgi:branched-chain amino acid transport system substrate-binding protein
MQGEQALAGLQSWAADVNQSGGLRAGGPGSLRTVSVVHYDDASRPDQVRRLTRQLIREDRVDLLVGPYSSGLALAAAAVAEEYGKVLWNQGGASDRIYQQGYRWELTRSWLKLSGYSKMILK